MSQVISHCGFICTFVPMRYLNVGLSVLYFEHQEVYICISVDLAPDDGLGLIYLDIPWPQKVCSVSTLTLGT